MRVYESNYNSNFISTRHTCVSRILWTSYRSFISIIRQRNVVQKKLLKNHNCHQKRIKGVRASQLLPTQSCDSPSIFALFPRSTITSLIPHKRTFFATICRKTQLLGAPDWCKMREMPEFRTFSQKSCIFLHLVAEKNPFVRYYSATHLSPNKTLSYHPSMAIAVSPFLSIHLFPVTANELPIHSIIQTLTTLANHPGMSIHASPLLSIHQFPVTVNTWPTRDSINQLTCRRICGTDAPAAAARSVPAIKNK